MSPGRQGKDHMMGAGRWNPYCFTDVLADKKNLCTRPKELSNAAYITFQATSITHSRKYRNNIPHNTEGDKIKVEPRRDLKKSGSVQCQ